MFSYYTDMPHFTGVTYGFPFLFGPIFYLYARLVSSEDNSFHPRYLLHFIPFALVVIYGFIFVYMKSGEYKISLIQNDLAFPPPGLKFISLLKPVHGIIYVLLTIKLLRAYNNRIKNSFSNTERINLNWLLHLTVGLTFVWGIVVLTYIVNMVSSRNVKMDYFIYMAASLLIYSIGYLSLRQPQIFGTPDEKPETGPVPSDPGIPAETGYLKSGLTDEEAKGYVKNLVKLMETEKPYLNSELTLRDLAASLSVSAHNLSEILNTRLNQNFYDFINTYRVEEVKRRLADYESQKYNLISVAFDSGFNSKTTFNTIFKKHTGLTPSQFRKQIEHSLTAKQ